MIVLFTHLLGWWGFWAYRIVESWNLAKFSLVLLNPGILMVVSTTLVVNASKLDRNWDQHFFVVRRSFFVIFGMIPVGAMLRDWVLFDTPVATGYHLPELLMITIFVVGWATANRRIHSALVLAALVAAITFTTFIWLQPGAGREFAQ